MKNKFNHPSLVSFMQLNLFCALLLGVRFGFTLTPHYFFLVWNLMLAAVPLAIGTYITSRRTAPKSWLALVLTWLLFLPNAPYLITDLLHFRGNQDMAAWFDLLLLSSFGMAGMLFGVESLHVMRGEFQHRFGRKTASALIFCCCILCGAGIYLGRFLRYNSWDIITDPLALLHDLALLFSPRGIGVSLGFGLLFYLAYSYICNHFKPKYHVTSPQT